MAGPQQFNLKGFSGPSKPMADPTAVMQGLAGAGAGTPTPGRFSGIKNFLKKPVSKSAAGGVAGGLGFMLAEMLASTLQNERGLDIGADLQSQQLDIQSEAASPENFLIQALLPSSEQQKQQAMQALMQQLTGGNAPRQLARGEVLT